jgi:hypothetical protein
MYIEKIKQEYDSRQEPRLGDYVMVEGSLERICVIHRATHEIQTSDVGSFYLGRDGSSTFSGACINFKRSRNFDRINLDKLRLVDSEIGEFWTFKDGEVGCGRGEGFSALCRVFEIFH